MFLLCNHHFRPQQGDAITFSWHFVGIGEEKCFHDGVELPECESPMRVTANDVSSADTTHTFQVKFVDVCGATKTVDYKYTQRVRANLCFHMPAVSLRGRLGSVPEVFQRGMR